MQSDCKTKAERERNHPVCLHTVEKYKRWTALIQRMIMKQRVKMNR